jgi:hypothetical protein
VSEHPSRVKTGLSWVAGSYQLFFQNPAKWLMLALAYVLLFVVLPALPHMPILITLLIVLFWPCFIALAIGVYREEDQGRDTELVDLWQQVKPHVAMLIALGGICLVYCILVGMFASGDTQALTELINQKADPQQILAQALPLMAKLFILFTPLLMALWFSPMLIAYQGFSVTNAIKHSLWACWHNMVAISVAWLVLTVALALAMMAMGIIVGLVATISQPASFILMALTLLFGLLVATSFMFAIQYFSYRHMYYQKPDTNG